ncbi:FAD-binding domain-containing protein [Microthyrium microscopicum]|uniref:FAD-binding domain-containing protein n=1 Tax=Microthyrium microscopicum TaxID=703497 RepID=A0A6A6U0Y8_9PEZI|nr:FAD-binding domain-containing protein [Microthyrium microscopicum]
MKIRYSISLLVAGVVSTLLDAEFFSIPSPGTDITAFLGPRLSSNAAIILPNQPNWANASARWQGYSIPTYQAVVEVSTEKDIQQTILFANNHSIPFIAIGGGHGYTTTMGRMKNGIGISLKRMKTIELDKNNNTAHFGPGLTNGEVLRGLEALGKRTATGNCECAGLGGLLLGGGKGLLQGRFGLVADNLVEARVVLANGSAITASINSNTDLFWALKGAGHNFGIVSEFHQRIYSSEPEEKWVVTESFFTQDKLEILVQIMNGLLDNGKTPYPVGLATFLGFMRSPERDSTKAVLRLLLIHPGSKKEAARLLQPFDSITPISRQTSVTKYTGVVKIIGVSDDGPGCRPPGARHSLPISLLSYNVDAMREAYTIFNNYTAQHEELSKSAVLFEGYSTQAVRAVAEESTAVSDRQFNILVGNFVHHSAAAIVAVEPAYLYGRKIRDVLFAGSGLGRLPAYVNYAYGDETVEQIYGDGWRMEKLRRLKKEYDPSERFNFYNPIV